MPMFPIRCGRRVAVLLALVAVSAQSQAQTQTQPPLRVHAAGSLRLALSEVARSFSARPGEGPVSLVFGASGLLKDRLAGGEPGHVFASANMAHPEALAAAGLAGPVQRFARNRMCLLLRPGLDIAADGAVAALLDPTLKLGVSTPRADPAGDYALQVFDRIEQAGHAGAAAALRGRALQLTGGPGSPPPPPDRSVYGLLLAQGAADLFLTYCTNAAQALREQPGQRNLALPESVDVAASYGLTLLNGAPEPAQRFVDYLLSPTGQALLAGHGFAPR